MSFVADVREEAILKSEKKHCCQLAELLGITLFSEAISGGEWVVSTEHESLKKHISILLRRAFNLRESVRWEEKKVYIDNPGDTLAVLSGLSLLGRMEASEELLSEQCCQRAFIRGAFLVAGTMSDPEKEYRAEFTFADNPTLCRMLCEALEVYELRPKITMRLGRYVVYFKTGEEFSDLLKILGANQSVLEFLNIRIIKQSKNEANRLMNCDMANINKTMESAKGHLDAIHKIKERGEYNALPEKIKEAAEARLENPDASIAEIGKILGISKPAASHRLKKLMEYAE